MERGPGLQITHYFNKFNSSLKTQRLLFLSLMFFDKYTIKNVSILCMAMKNKQGKSSVGETAILQSVDKWFVLSLETESSSALQCDCNVMALGNSVHQNFRIFNNCLPYALTFVAIILRDCHQSIKKTCHLIYPQFLSSSVSVQL